MYWNCFDVKCVSSVRYSESFTIHNIQNKFETTGLWYPRKLSAWIDALNDLQFFKPQFTVKPSVTDIIKTFKQKEKSLFRDVVVFRSGVLAMNTTSDAHFTADVVLEVLGKREEKRLRFVLVAIVRVF